jgi:hypothetical protein
VILLAVVVRMSGRGPSFDLLKVVYSQRFPTGLMSRLVAAARISTSRDFFAFVLAILAISGVGAPAIPWLILLAAASWLLFILGGAPMLLTAAAGSGAPAPASQP